MNREKNTGRAVAGFILTLFTCMMIFMGGLIITLRFGIFKGNDINSFLDNIDFHEALQKIVVTEVRTKINETTGSGEAAALSADAVDTLLTEDVVRDMTTTVTKAVLEDEPINLNEMKDECMDTVKEVSSKAVDDIIDEISETSKVVNLDALKNSSIIKQYQEDYKVDITSTIMDKMKTMYNSTSINLDEIDVEEVKAEAQNAINEYILPVLEEKVDKYVADANDIVNREVQKIKEDDDVMAVKSAVKGFSVLMNVALVVAVLVIVALALVQICLVYRKEKHRAFRNIGIASGVSAAMTVLTVALLGIVRNMLGDIFDKNDEIENIIMEFVDSNMARVTSDIVITAVVTGVIFVVCMIISRVVKNKKVDTVA